MKRRRRNCLVTALPALLLACATVHADETNSAAPPAPDSQAGLPSSAERKGLQQDVEFLRGLKFRRDVPMKSVSREEMREGMVKDFEKQYPGRKLADYQELLIRTALVPPGTDLADAVGRFTQDEVAGAYDPETKQMYIPRPTQTALKPGAGPNPANKAAAELPDFASNVILVHEFTHAVEDQYWDLEDLAGAKAKKLPDNSERDLADDCVLEGSATRIMVEGMAASFMETNGSGNLDSFPVMWEFLHSGVVEFGLHYGFLSLWQGDNAKVSGVPDALAQAEIMPYSFGYVFCTRTMRDWGVAGLDYVHAHPPGDSRQVIHPRKYWEGVLPVTVELPPTLPGGWTNWSEDAFGEAGMLLLFGNNLRNMPRGEGIARGWDGDRVALYKNDAGRWLTVWAMSCASESAAADFATACLDMRRKMFKASTVAQASLPAGSGGILPPVPTAGAQSTWTCPDARHGFISRAGKRVVVVESDATDAFPSPATINDAVRFTEPPTDAARENNAFVAYNPLLSSWHNGDYSVTRSLCGLLWRHEHNPLGRADSCVLDLVNSHRSETFHRWRLAWALLANHEADDRRRLTQTSLLPWGLLWRHFASPVPRAPDGRIQHDSCLWGIAGSRTRAGDRSQLHLVLGGVLLREDKSPDAAGFFILGTGARHEKILGKELTTVRLLGFRVYHTKESAPKPKRPATTETAHAGARPSPVAASHEERARLN